MPEKFNPSNQEYKKTADLPTEKRDKFVDLKNGGFVKKTADDRFKSAVQEAMGENYMRKEVAILNGEWPSSVEKVRAVDILHEEAELDELIDNTDGEPEIIDSRKPKRGGLPEGVPNTSYNRSELARYKRETDRGMTGNYPMRFVQGPRYDLRNKKKTK